MPTHISPGGTVGIGKSPDAIFARTHPDTSVAMSPFPRATFSRRRQSLSTVGFLIYRWFWLHAEVRATRYKAFFTK